MLSENAKNRWMSDFENGVSLSFAPKSVRDDKNLVLIAVGLNGMDLKYASERLQSDIDVVKTAIRENMMALQFASKDLQYQFKQGGFDKLQELKGQMEDDHLDPEQKFMNLYHKLVKLMYEQKNIFDDIMDVEVQMLNLYPSEALKVFTVLENLNASEKYSKTK